MDGNFSKSHTPIGLPQLRLKVRRASQDWGIVLELHCGEGLLP